MPIETVTNAAETYGIEQYNLGRDDEHALLQPQLDAANAQLDDIIQQLIRVQADNATLQARIDALLAQLAARRPILGATASRTAATATTPAETYPQATARVLGQLNPGALRIYDDGQGTEKLLWAMGQTGQLGRIEMHGSFHADLASMIAGDQNANIRNLCSGLPTTIPTVLTFFHEFDVAVAKGTTKYTAADFKQAFTVFNQQVRLFGNPMIHTAVIMSMAERVATYWPGDENTDFCGWDPYCHVGGQLLRDFLLPQIATLRKITARPLIVAEIGMKPPTGSTVTPAPTGLVNDLDWLFAQGPGLGIYALDWFQAAGYALSGTDADTFKAHASIPTGP